MSHISSRYFSELRDITPARDAFNSNSSKEDKIQDGPYEIIEFAKCQENRKLIQDYYHNVNKSASVKEAVRDTIVPALALEVFKEPDENVKERRIQKIAKFLPATSHEGSVATFFAIARMPEKKLEPSLQESVLDLEFSLRILADRYRGQSEDQRKNIIRTLLDSEELSSFETQTQLRRQDSLPTGSSDAASLQSQTFPQGEAPAPMQVLQQSAPPPLEDQLFAASSTRGPVEAKPSAFYGTEYLARSQTYSRGQAPEPQQDSNNTLQVPQQSDKRRVIALNDPLYYKAVCLVRNDKNTATAIRLSDELSCGWSMARYLINQMEDDKIVGPFRGAHPRKVSEESPLLREPITRTNNQDLDSHVPTTATAPLDPLYNNAVAVVNGNERFASLAALQDTLNITPQRAKTLLGQMKANNVPGVGTQNRNNWLKLEEDA